MLSIQDLLKVRDTKTKANSERAYVIGEIAQQLRIDRLANPFYIKNGKKVKLPEIKDHVVAIRVSYIKSVNDLYYLLSSCKQAKSFSKMFWYLTKTTVR